MNPLEATNDILTGLLLLVGVGFIGMWIMIGVGAIRKCRESWEKLL